jgi:hypothetical protein
LRSLTPLNNDLILVESLGLFIFVSGSTEPDDDETAFATASGVWELLAPHYNVISKIQGIEDAWQNSRILFGNVNNSITSLAPSASVSFSGTVTGSSVGDNVLVILPSVAFIIAYGIVTSANTVTIYLSNPSASTQSVPIGLFPVTIFKDQ